MAKQTYSEKLKDPRWQKIRLIAMERDGWKCTSCHSDKKTLHVHHIKYIKNRDPWEYDYDNFLTLCCDCHELIHRDTSCIDEGAISAKSLVFHNLEIKKYFSSVKNHEGVWELTIRPNTDLNDIETLCGFIRATTKLMRIIKHCDQHIFIGWDSSRIEWNHSCNFFEVLNYLN